MDNNRLKEYAELLAKKGINVLKGEEVWINCQLDQIEFVRLCVEECYKAGAKKVRVRFSDNKISRLNYQYMALNDLKKVPEYSISEYKYMVKHLPSMLHIISDDPDAFKGIKQSILSKSSLAVRKKVKPYRNKMDGNYKWCIAAVPNTEWAERVFPNLKGEDAVNALWEAILKTSRVDGNAIQNWENHNQNLYNKRQILESLDLQYLEYHSSNGTNFKVELIKGIHWGGGAEYTSDHRIYNPNIPSEEVFTSPLAGSCEGIVYASKPLSYNGQLIEGFSIRFEGGKVTEVKAKKNQKLLEQMVNMDMGARQLGEVALVPFDSPIQNSGLLFYETLFDENAACHLALGQGFKELLPDGGASLSIEEAKQRGLNDSMIHVDFMIGTSDLEIIGTSFSGKKTTIFKNGNWAI
ncbi:MAG: aminopeptidase [Bacilli bacterium]|nr:aminopeptidase [Bacilli bacterium]